jgi:hypothetical protein
MLKPKEGLQVLLESLFPTKKSTLPKQSALGSCWVVVLSFSRS